MSMMAATLLTLAAGAAGQGGSEPATAKPEVAKDQVDPIICHSNNEIGSRLKRQKVCMRRSEWQRQRQDDKQTIDRAQLQRGLDPGDTVG